MEKITKNSFLVKKWLDIKWKIISLVAVVVVLIIGVVGYITFGINEEQAEIKSVEIKSDGWDEEEPGAWKITKSAEWTGLNEAQITMDLETMPKYVEVNANYDVVFALDVSTSMAGEKFDSLKESLKKYLEEVLDNTDNRIAFVEYHTEASVLSDFTNNIADLNSVIDNLELKCSGEIIDGVEQDWGYCTNYTDGLVKVADVLEDYIPEEGRQLTVLFLTDGSANRDVGLIKSKYTYLKKKFPNIVIHGIQYEMGSNINSYLKLASDDQYDAYVDDIYDKFFIATYADILAGYEKFDITDYISDYFYIESENDIKANKGIVEFDEENQRVIWNVASDILMSGTRAKLTIDVSAKEPYSGINGYYPTNSGEEIISRLTSEEPVEIKSNLTPVLKNFYSVVYEINAPNECSLPNIEFETHFVYETVTKRSDKLICEGYVFRGWEYLDSDNDIKKISQEAFIMPERNVVIKAVWGVFGISKSMEGIISTEPKFLYEVVKEGAVLDNIKSTYVSEETGINFKNPSSDTNGKGNYLLAETKYDNYPVYYYRGEVTNNNIIYAGFCWKIVRTTETGGIKLIYNGETTEGNTCNNLVGTATMLGTIQFNSSHDDLKYMGYMYDTNKSSEIKEYIDSWYEENLKDTVYENYLEDTIWCNDRSIGKTETDGILYGSRYRASSYTPSLICKQVEDKFTVKATSKLYNANLNGNKLLNYPIALLTADELVYAGARLNVVNHTYYLYNKQSYWLLSPDMWHSSTSRILLLAATSEGSFANGRIATYSHGVRPAVSLNFNTTVTSAVNGGEAGSADNPYIVG